MRKINLSSILLLRTQPSVCAGFLAKILGPLQVKKSCYRYVVSRCCSLMKWNVEDAFETELRAARCYAVLLTFRAAFPREVIWRIIDYAGINTPRAPGGLAEATRDAVGRGRVMATPFREQQLMAPA